VAWVQSSFEVPPEVREAAVEVEGHQGDLRDALGHRRQKK
jgi:hypothetical protein